MLEGPYVVDSVRRGPLLPNWANHAEQRQPGHPQLLALVLRCEIGNRQWALGQYTTRRIGADPRELLAHECRDVADRFEMRRNQVGVAEPVRVNADAACLLDASLELENPLIRPG